jgi:hypothetical protein
MALVVVVMSFLRSKPYGRTGLITKLINPVVSKSPGEPPRLEVATGEKPNFPSADRQDV